MSLSWLPCSNPRQQLSLSAQQEHCQDPEAAVTHHFSKSMLEILSMGRAEQGLSTVRQKAADGDGTAALGPPALPRPPLLPLQTVQQPLPWLLVDINRFPLAARHNALQCTTQ